MKKLLLTMMTVLLTWVAVMAVPAKPGLKKVITQSDGTTITLSLMGDEWHHSWVTSDGKPTVKAANGDMVYRTADGPSTVVAHEKAQRGADEVAFLSANAASMTAQAIMDKSSRVRAGRANAARRAGPRKAAGDPEVPQTGKPKIPIILVQYTDVTFKNSKDAFVKQYTSTTSLSAYKYFYDQSDGQYAPQYDVYGPYTLSGTRATYGGNDSNGDDVGVAKMVGEAIDVAGSDINWANYDNDSDGEADVCIVVYAGGGEAQTSVEEQIWPCQWSLSSGKSYGDGTGTRTRNGKKIDKFAVFNELNGTSTTKLDGVGTFCHEYGHCMGLPDFYETTYDNGYYGMGYWDIMCAGSYNNDGYCPIGYNAYEKEFMGWYTPVTPVENNQYTLPKWNTGNDKAIKVTSPLNSNECYYLENRAKQGWDAYIADEGMLVTHLTYVASRWTANTPNNQAVQLFTVIPADNKLSENNEKADCYGESNHELTDTSTPAATLNMKANGSLASTTGGAGKMGQPLTDIYLNSDGTVSFWYMRGETEALAAPVLNDATNITTDGWTASWSAVDNAGSYELQINGTSSSASGSVYSLVTDASSLSAGDRIIFVDAAAGAAAGELSNSVLQKVDVDVENNQVDLSGVSGVNVFTLDGQAGAWTFQLSDGSYLTQTAVKKLSTGSSGTTASISIANGLATITMGSNVLCYNVSSPRFTTYSKAGNTLRAPSIYRLGGSSSGAPARAASTTKTITGITGTSYNVTGMNDDTDYTFKVRAIPSNTAEYSNSAWSNEKTVHTIAADPEPLIVADDKVELAAYVDNTEEGAISILYEDLSAPITATLSGADASMFTLERTTIAIDGSGDGKSTLALTYHPTAEGTHNATVTLSSEGADDVTVALVGMAEYQLLVPVMNDAQAVTSTSFKASWTDATPADKVASYTLYVNKTGDTGGEGGGGETAGTEYVKVTSSSDLTSGKYLIVYEEGSVAFNGGLEKLDATSNTITVTLNNNKITATDATNAACFTYDATAGTLKSASGLYIGNNSDSNSLSASTTEAYKNTVSLDGTDAKIVSSGGAYLRYNAQSGQTRFRYFKSGSYTNQKAIQLYKLTGSRSAPRRAVSESGDADTSDGLTVTGITDKEYTVSDLTPGATYDFKVKAVYTADTESEWSNTENVTLLESTDPKLEVSAATVAFSDVVVGTTATQTFTVKGTNLTDVVNVNIAGDNVLTVAPSTISAEDAAAGATVTVTYAPTAFATASATVTLSSTGAPDAAVAVTATSALEKHAPVMAEAANVSTNSFKAVWTDETPAENVDSYTLYVNMVPEVTGYELVTDASQLKAGDQLIITNAKAEGSAYAISTDVLSTYYLNQAAVTIASGPMIEDKDLGAKVETFTLGGSTGAWYLKANSSTNKNKYLYTTSSGVKLGYSSTLNNYSKMSIAIANTGVATMTFLSGATNKTIEYYSYYSEFTCYSTSSANVYIFRKEGTDTGGGESGGGETGTTTVNDVLNNANTINDTETGSPAKMCV